MTPKQVRKKRQEIDKRLRANRVERDRIVAELKILKDVECEHPSTYKSGDYSGATYLVCNDCGKEI